MILFAEIKVNFKNPSAAVRQADLNIIVRQPTYCTVAFAVLRSVAGSHAWHVADPHQVIADPHHIVTDPHHTVADPQHVVTNPETDPTPCKLCFEINHYENKASKSIFQI